MEGAYMDTVSGSLQLVNGDHLLRALNQLILGGVLTQQNVVTRQLQRGDNLSTEPTTTDAMVFKFPWSSGQAQGFVYQCRRLRLALLGATAVIPSCQAHR